MVEMVSGTDGVKLAYEEMGSGAPPLVLVHGFTGGRVDWADVLEPLATSRRVITYTHRGHADSEHLDDPAGYTLERLRADLGAVVDAKQLAPMHLLGHSMGGVVALGYALDHPQQIASLILMDTFAEPAGRGLADMLAYAVNMGREQGMPAVADMLAKLFEQMPSPTSPERAAVARERMRRKVAAMDVEAFNAFGLELSTHESMVDRLGELRCPVTVVVGELDSGLRQPAEVMATHIDGAELEVIANTGHSPQEDDPDAWLAVLEAHLARANASA